MGFDVRRLVFRQKLLLAAGYALQALAPTIVTFCASTAGTIGGARAFNALNTSQGAMARLLRQSAQQAAPATIDTTLSKAISASALANALQGGR